MIALIASIFPTLAGWLNMILGFFQQRAANQTAANQAETAAEASHSGDGALSVAGKTSDDAQNAALDQLAQQLDNPTPIVVVKAEVKNVTSNP